MTGIKLGNTVNGTTGKKVPFNGLNLNVYWNFYERKHLLNFSSTIILFVQFKAPIVSILSIKLIIA